MTYAQSQARQGFTLMELMIAITILAIIGVVGIPTYFSYVEQARKGKAQTTLRTLKGGIMLYQAQVGRYPKTLKDLVRPPMDPQEKKKWQKGGYLGRKDLPEDPWNNRYKYTLTPGGEHPYELYSYGSEGKNTPKAERISVWDE